MVKLDQTTVSFSISFSKVLYLGYYETFCCFNYLSYNFIAFKDFLYGTFLRMSYIFKNLSPLLERFILLVFLKRQVD